MPTLLEALKKSGLVESEKAARIEKERAEKDRKQEEMTNGFLFRSILDEKEQKKQEQFLARASKETTKASSRVGTPQYYARFK